MVRSGRDGSGAASSWAGGQSRASCGMHVVVVVTALEGVPDALDVGSVVFERVEAAVTREVGCLLGCQSAGGRQAAMRRSPSGESSWPPLAIMPRSAAWPVVWSETRPSTVWVKWLVPVVTTISAPRVRSPPGSQRAHTPRAVPDLLPAVLGRLLPERPTRDRMPAPTAIGRAAAAARAVVLVAGGNSERARRTRLTSLFCER